MILDSEKIKEKGSDIVILALQTYCQINGNRFVSRHPGSDHLRVGLKKRERRSTTERLSRFK